MSILNNIFELTPGTSIVGWLSGFYPWWTFHQLFCCCLFLDLQFQTLLLLTCPTAKSITRPPSAGDCLRTTCLLTTTCLNTAGECKCKTKDRTVFTQRPIEVTIIFSFYRLGGPGQSPSQEDGEDSGVWRATDRVYGPSTVVCDLDPNSLYAFRVRSCRNSMFSPYSPEVTFHTPPAPGESDRQGDVSCRVCARLCPWCSVGREQKREREGGSRHDGVNTGEAPGDKTLGL